MSENKMFSLRLNKRVKERIESMRRSIERQTGLKITTTAVIHMLLEKGMDQREKETGVVSFAHEE